MRRIGCVAWIFSKPIAEVYKCVSLISFSASWCMLLFTEAFIYFLVYTSTQVFDRISVSHGVPREHCEDTWWPRWMGAVGQPSIRRLRSQILLYLIKPMSWVEVYLVLRYIFVRKESALQVKVSFKTPPRENKAQTGEKDLVLEPLFSFFIERNVLQECFLETFRITLTGLVRYVHGCLMPVSFGVLRKCIFCAWDVEIFVTRLEIMNFSVLLTIQCSIKPCRHYECRSKCKDNCRLSGGLYNFQISTKSRACVQASHRFLMMQSTWYIE